MVYGDLELHPYIHQKGNNAGQAAITPQIMVKDWQFLPANRNDTNAATPVPGNPMVGNPNVPPVPANGATYAPAGGSAYAPQGFTAGNVSGDGFTNIPENTPPQQLPFP